MSQRGTWREMVRALGQSILDLLSAELGELSEDLGRNGRAMLWVIGLVAGVAALAFWTTGMLVAALVSVLAIWLPVWAASLIVLGVLLLALAIIAGVAWLRFKRLELPVATIRRRWRDHLRWWQERVLGEGEESDDARSRES